MSNQKQIYEYIYSRFLDLNPKYNHVKHTWGPTVDFYTDIGELEKDDVLFSITVSTEKEELLFVYKCANDTRLIVLKEDELGCTT